MYVNERMFALTEYLASECCRQLDAEAMQQGLGGLGVPSHFAVMPLRQHATLFLTAGMLYVLSPLSPVS